jgi:hypothetical protein
MPWKRLGCGNALPINMVMLEGSIAEQVLGIVRMPFFFNSLWTQSRKLCFYLNLTTKQAAGIEQEV